MIQPFGSLLISFCKSRNYQNISIIYKVTQTFLSKLQGRTFPQLFAAFVCCPCILTPVLATSPHPSDAYYALDRVLEVDIDISPTAWDSLSAQTRSFVDLLRGDCLAQPHENIFSWFRATVTVDNETHTEVGIRKKGFFGSLSETKPALKIRFDKFVDGQLLDGVLKRITLNNVQQDPSMINTCMSYHVFASAGIPSPRCNFAKVRVNGKNMGLYVHIESIKTAFLERNFADATGNLYEGNVSDFRAEWDGTFTKKTNEGQRDYSDIDAVVNALEDTSPTGIQSLAEIVDIDRFLTFWAVEVLVGHWDGYAGNRNNYYFYREPNSRFVFIPWGADGTFTTIDGPFDGFRTPPSVAANAAIPHRLYQDDDMRSAYVTRLRQLLDTVWNEQELVGLVDEMATIVQANVLEKNRARTDRDADRVRKFIRNQRSKILEDLEPEPPEWPWPLASADFCWPETGKFYITFEAKWGTIDSEQPLEEGLAEYTDYELGGIDQRFEKTGVTAGLNRKGEVELSFFGLTGERNLDILVVSIESDRIVNGSSAVIEGMHMLASPPYSAPEYDGLIGKGHIIFDQAEIKPGAKIVGRVYGTLYGGSSKEESTSDDLIEINKELVINEVASKGDPLDWFELYNPTKEEINLARFVVADDWVDGGKRVPFPNDLTIQPGEYMQVTLDKNGWPGFALGGDEELGIWREDGEPVDRVDWQDGEAGEGVSFARIPDIKGEFQTVDKPTPGAPNQTVTAILETSTRAPKTFRLQGNWPNPFNANTTIGFELPEARSLQLVIYDILGQRVRELYSGNNMGAGYHQIIWDGLDDQGQPSASGIYIYRFSGDGFVEMGSRMVLIR